MLVNRSARVSKRLYQYCLLWRSLTVALRISCVTISTHLESALVRTSPIYLMVPVDPRASQPNFERNQPCRAVQGDVGRDCLGKIIGYSEYRSMKWYTSPHQIPP